jgi:hypothetical protein
MVEERVEGTRRITHNGRPLTDQAIVARPQRPVTPTRAHPWRKRLLLTRDTHEAAAII